MINNSITLVFTLNLMSLSVLWITWKRDNMSRRTVHGSERSSLTPELQVSMDNLTQVSDLLQAVITAIPQFRKKTLLSVPFDQDLKDPFIAQFTPNTFMNRFSLMKILKILDLNKLRKISCMLFLNKLIHQIHQNVR